MMQSRFSGAGVYRIHGRSERDRGGDIVAMAPTPPGCAGSHKPTPPVNPRS